MGHGHYRVTVWARRVGGGGRGGRHGCAGLEAASGLQLMLWVHDKQSVNLISSFIECTVCIYLYIYFCMFICMDHSVLYRYEVTESEHAAMHWYIYFFRKRVYTPACVQMKVNYHWSLNLSTSHCICTRRPRLHRPVDLFIYYKMSVMSISSLRLQAEENWLKAGFWGTWEQKRYCRDECVWDMINTPPSPHSLSQNAQQPRMDFKKGKGAGFRFRIHCWRVSKLSHCFSLRPRRRRHQGAMVQER